MKPAGSRRRPLPHGSPWLGLVLLAGCAGEMSERPAAVDDAAQPPSSLTELVEAERAFARLSMEEGARTAFLTWFAPDAMSFTPVPTQGTSVIEAWPAEPPALDWAPERAGISASGDLGYTTGPFRSEGPGGVIWGHYHSVWRRTPEGPWRVVLDIGVPHGPVPWPVESVEVPAPIPAGPTSDPSPGPESVLDVDRRYDATWRAEGREAAAARFVAPYVHVARNGRVPSRGREAWLAAVSEVDEPEGWSPEGGGTSSSSDLGYTWGTGRLRARPDAEPGLFSYARVWRRGGDGWRVVLEVVSAYPPEAGSNPTG